jgi:hypothetical protein
MPATQAGLSEATDFDGPWTTAGTSYVSGPSGPLPSTGIYWVEQSAITLDGTDAVEGRLGSIDGVQTWMETEVTGPATLYFSYRVRNFNESVMNIHGSFVVRAGGMQILMIPSDVNGLDTGWREATAVIPAGPQKVQWNLSYFRGQSGVSVFIDQVWTSTDPRPRLAGPPSQTCVAGTPFSLVVGVTSSTPATLTAVGLPPGLVADPTSFAISGIPTKAGTFEATLTTTNAAGRHSVMVPFQVESIATSLPLALDAPSLMFSEPGGGSYWGGSRVSATMVWMRPVPLSRILDWAPARHPKVR